MSLSTVNSIISSSSNTDHEYDKYGQPIPTLENPNPLFNPDDPLGDPTNKGIISAIVRTTPLTGLLSNLKPRPINDKDVVLTAMALIQGQLDVLNAGFSPQQIEANKEAIADIQTSITKINTQYEDCVNEYHALKSVTDNLTGDISAINAAEKKITDRISGLGDKILTLTGDIKVVQGKVDGLSDTVVTIHTLVDGHTGAIAEVKTSLSNVSEVLNGLTTKFDTLYKSVSDTANDVKNLQTSTKTNSDNIEKLTTLVNTLSDTIEKMKTQMTATQADIENLKKDGKTNADGIASNLKSITSIDTRVSDNEKNIDACKTGITDLTTEVKSNTDAVGVIKSGLSDLDQTVKTLSTTVETDRTSSVEAISAINNVIESQYKVYTELPTEFTGTTISAKLGKQDTHMYTWDEVTKTYVRAPWDQPGILKFAETGTNDLPGHIAMDAKTTVTASENPDLAKYLPIAEPVPDESSKLTEGDSSTETSFLIPNYTNCEFVGVDKEHVNDPDLVSLGNSNSLHTNTRKLTSESSEIDPTEMMFLYKRVFISE